MHTVKLSNVSSQEFDRMQIFIACGIYSKATEYNARRITNFENDVVMTNVTFSKDGEYVILTFIRNMKTQEAEIYFDVAFSGTVRKHEDFIKYVSGIVLPNIRDYVATRAVVAA